MLRIKNRSSSPLGKNTKKQSLKHRGKQARPQALKVRRRRKHRGRQARPQVPKVPRPRTHRGKQARTQVPKVPRRRTHRGRQARPKVPKVPRRKTLKATFALRRPAGLQISGLKFQSSNSNSRKLELSNFLGLVLGCIEAKFASKYSLESSRRDLHSALLCTVCAILESNAPFSKLNFCLKIAKKTIANVLPNLKFC